MPRLQSEPLPAGVFPVRKPNKTYWYYTPNRGKPNEGERRRLPERGTPEWHDEIERIRREQLGVPALYDMRSLVRDHKLSTGWQQLEKSTQATYTTAIKPILAQWRYRRPADITIADVSALVEHLADKPAMANMTLTLARKLMRFAVQRNLRKDNPARDVDMLDEAGDGAKPLTADAWAALMAHECPVPLYRLATLGRFTGQRISDLITMRPCDREDDGIAHKIKKLGGKAHWSILTLDQAQIIDGWAGDREASYIRKSTGAPYTTDGLRLVWNRYARSKPGAALQGFTPHDLRATKVCDERIAGKTHQQIAAMVGMSIQKVMHYSRHIDQRLVARGAARVEAPSQSGPLGRIYDLDEAAAYMRVLADDVAALARKSGIGAVFGEKIRFTEDDIRTLWDSAKQPNP